MPRRKGGAGRPGGLDEARELVALVASLSEAGDALSAGAVAARLGVSRERAEKLVALVLTAAGAGGSRLPLVEEDGAVTMLLTRGMRGRAVRLTTRETVAVEAALERLGVREDDPLRERLEGALAPAAPSENLVRRLVSGEKDPALAALIADCARALAERRDLRFLYRRAGGGPAGPRCVTPLRLRCEDDAWYLEAYDRDRAGERTFRLDRMSEMENVSRAPEPAPTPVPQTAPTVRITFDDPRYLDLLPWHDLHVLERGEKYVVAETPSYGSSWLPRMLAACGGSAHVDDPTLAEQARAYARGQLAEARA